MRETCLRVLAAGLMTGAIAAVVGMPALLGPPSDPGRPIAAPPSPLQHPVRIHVAPAPPHKRAVERFRAVRATSRPAPPTVITRHIVIIHTSPPRRRLATTKPKPTPAAPAASTATPPAETPQVQAPPPAPPAPAADDGDDAEGHGHAYGHDKEHGPGHNKHQD